MARALQSVPDTPKRAAFYVRVSDVGIREAERFHSPELQLDAMRRYAASRGLTETAVYEDIDATGRNFQRAGVQAALEAARTGQIDALVVLDLSRLGRNTGESLRVISELRALGVALISTTEQIDDTPEGQFMLGQFLGMAQLYSDQMGRRWKSVQQHMHGRGRQVGRPPVGYLQTDTGRVTATGRKVMSGAPQIDPVLAPVVRQIFADYATGASTGDLADTLSAARGVTTHRSKVRAMVRNRYYLGEVRLNDQWAKGQHEPLIDQDLWEACRRRRDIDRRTPSRSLKTVHPLAGLAVCDGCSRPVHCQPPGPRRSVAHYRCALQREHHQCAGCGTMSVPKVVEFVLAWCVDYTERLKVNDVEQTARRARRAQAVADASRLAGELRKTRNARARLAIDRAQRNIPAAVYTDADAELARVEAALLVQIAKAEARQGTAPRATAAAAKELVDLWPDATNQERNRLLKLIIAQVRLRPGPQIPPEQRIEIVPL